MKSQVALEYFIIVAIALTIIVPYVIYSNELFIDYRDNNDVMAAKNAVNKIGQSADWVFAQGPPAQISTEVFIPDGVTQTLLVNNTIEFKVRTVSGVSDVFYISTANVTGSLPTTSGYYTVSITATNNSVSIGV